MIFSYLCVATILKTISDDAKIYIYNVLSKFFFLKKRWF